MMWLSEDFYIGLHRRPAGCLLKVEVLRTFVILYPGGNNHEAILGRITI
jgi:hypothetical protein